MKKTQKQKCTMKDTRWHFFWETKKETTETLDGRNVLSFRLISR